MHVSVSYEFLPKTPSAHAAVVMDHFGLGFETGRHVIADGLEIPILPGDVVAFTGPSGSGKSSLMRAAAAQLEGVLVADALDLGDRILVDALDRPAPETLGLLSSCGLGEAQLMLRTPSELSDGQRYRFRLSLAVSRSPQWIVADEFTAALDRTLAKVIAFNLRKLATRTGVGFLLATTHEDILDDLQPDVHVRCGLDGQIEVRRGSGALLAPSPGASLGEGWGEGASPFASLGTPNQTTKDTLTLTLSHRSGGRGDQAGGAVKKKTSASPASCGCRAAPSPTGRISLGGITGRTLSASSST
ncbi:MAG: hypothetical protein SH850_11760 [Planctomycetaceae bacterium]|nr:hypothetical protein [Planctomycetaceae bacterium]